MYICVLPTDGDLILKNSIYPNMSTLPPPPGSTPHQGGRWEKEGIEALSLALPKGGLLRFFLISLLKSHLYKVFHNRGGELREDSWRDTCLFWPRGEKSWKSCSQTLPHILLPTQTPTPNLTILKAAQEQSYLHSRCG